MDVVRLVSEARARHPQAMRGRERYGAAGLALAFVLAAGGIAAVLPRGEPWHPALAILLVVAYAFASQVEFEVDQGVAFATQLVFVPMLFLLPLRLVPLFVVVGLILGRVPEFAARRRHVDRWLLCVASSWFALGPVVLIGLLAPGPPRAAHAAIYGLALLSECAVDLAISVLGNRLMYRGPAVETIKTAYWAFVIDAAVSPVALVTASVAHAHPLAIAALPPLLWLISLFSKERTERYSAALELNQTYRGTVMVLADVVEADDNYTAHHCRSVVELAAAVAAELGLGYEQKQELEIAALLHDVGKIAIPKDVLNKPSQLTDEEFELMKTHTIEGQSLLERVGGRLARVGNIVRSCHERWDGHGYPDGLVREQIPLAARLVFCCDAYSAMTSDRPYRRGMSSEAALAELETNAGSQFDPRVVDALVQVVRSGALGEASTYSGRRACGARFAELGAGADVGRDRGLTGGCRRRRVDSHPHSRNREGHEATPAGQPDQCPRSERGDKRSGAQEGDAVPPVDERVRE